LNGTIVFVVRVGGVDRQRVAKPRNTSARRANPSNGMSVARAMASFGFTDALACRGWVVLSPLAAGIDIKRLMKKLR
jgi:hypothetical protein